MKTPFGFRAPMLRVRPEQAFYRVTHHTFRIKAGLGRSGPAGVHPTGQ